MNEWKRKTKGVDLNTLLQQVGFYSDSKARRNSSYVASYSSKLLSSSPMTVTGWYTETYLVSFEFTEKGYESWDRMAFEIIINKKYGQNAKFIDEFSGDGDKVYIVYNISILKLRRSL